MSTYTVGDIIKGKVTGIKPFGAFVTVDEKKQGLVHISEIAHGFVNDIHEELKVGEEVKVKILKIEEKSGRISLSIRATKEAPERSVSSNRPRTSRSSKDGRRSNQQTGSQQG